MVYLVGQKVKLTRFTERFIIPKYIEWINDHEINRYLLTGRIPVASAEIKDPNDFCNVMFAMMTKLYSDDSGQIAEDELFSNYIGTVFVNGIDWINRKGEVGYLIGDKTLWGEGLATEAVRLITDYALNRLNLHKIEAGVVSENKGSIRVLEKNGYKKYGTIPDDYWIEGVVYDVHRFYKLQGW